MIHSTWFCARWLILLIVGQFNDLSVTQEGHFGYSEWIDLGQEVELLRWTGCVDQSPYF